MIYSIKVTTPADTESQGILDVTRGLVYRVELMFPPGPGGLLDVSIWDGGGQVWPSSLGEVFDGDYMLISFEDLYIKQAPPWIFVIRTNNRDTKYEHAVTVRIGMVSARIFMARFLPNLAVDMQKEMWQELIKAAQEEQEAAREAERERVLATPFPWMGE